MLKWPQMPGTLRIASQGGLRHSWTVVERVAGRVLMVVPHLVRAVLAVALVRVPVAVLGAVLQDVRVVRVVRVVVPQVAQANVADVLAPVVPAAVVVLAVQGRRREKWRSILEIFKTA